LRATPADPVDHRALIMDGLDGNLSARRAADLVFVAVKEKS
jgi:hypothetical protein